VLDKVRNRFQAEQAAVLTINGDRHAKRMKRVLAKVNTSLPVLHDSESEIFKAYRAFAVPTIYLIDQQGKIYNGWTGYCDDLEGQLADSMAFLLESHTSPQSEGNDALAVGVAQ